MRISGIPPECENGGTEEKPPEKQRNDLDEDPSYF